jgi:hypothetical protein
VAGAAAGQFQLQQDGQNRTGGGSQLADQLVDFHGGWTQGFFHLGADAVGFAVEIG